MPKRNPGVKQMIDRKKKKKYSVNYLVQMYRRYGPDYYNVADKIGVRPNNIHILFKNRKLDKEYPHVSNTDKKEVYSFTLKIKRRCVYRNKDNREILKENIKNTLKHCIRSVDWFEIE